MEQVLRCLSAHRENQKLLFLTWFLIFAVLAVVLMFEPLENALVVDEFGKQIVSRINASYAIIVTVCLVLSIIDVLQTHVRRNESKKKSKE